MKMDERRAVIKGLKQEIAACTAAGDHQRADQLGQALEHQLEELRILISYRIQRTKRD